MKVGIPEFLSGIGGGVETHIAKLETELGDLPKLLVTRTLRLKKFGIPCKHVRYIVFNRHLVILLLHRSVTGFNMLGMIQSVSLKFVPLVKLL